MRVWLIVFLLNGIGDDCETLFVEPFHVSCRFEIGFHRNGEEDIFSGWDMSFDAVLGVGCTHGSIGRL